MPVLDSNATRITQLGTVFVPGHCPGPGPRALAFWVGKLGFEKRVDFSYDGGRWVEVAPPGSLNAIALARDPASVWTIGSCPAGLRADC